MNASKLTERVILQSLSTRQTDTGEPVAEWFDVAEVWARVADVSGREYLAAGATQNSALTKITIRYRDDVIPSMRLIHGQRAYNIEAELGQDRISLLLMCTRHES